MGNRGNDDCVPVNVPRIVFLVSPFPLSEVAPERVQGNNRGDFCGSGETLAATRGSGVILGEIRGSGVIFAATRGSGVIFAATRGSGVILAGDWAFPQRGCDFLRMETK